MVRAAAKNHASVAVVTDPGDYGALLDAVRAGGKGVAYSAVSREGHQGMNAKAFVGIEHVKT